MNAMKLLRLWIAALTVLWIATLGIGWYAATVWAAYERLEPSTRRAAITESAVLSQTQTAATWVVRGSVVNQPQPFPLPSPVGAERVLDLRRLARNVAGLCGVDPDVFERLIARESQFDTRAVSQTGARGLAQVFERTALAVNPAGTLDISRTYDNLLVGACYLRQQIDRYGLRRGLWAYHDGPGAIRRGPPSLKAQDYADDILGGVQ